MSSDSPRTDERQPVPPPNRPSGKPPRRFQCPDCPEWFWYRVDLTRHRNAIHAASPAASGDALREALEPIRKALGYSCDEPMHYEAAGTIDALLDRLAASPPLQPTGGWDDNGAPVVYQPEASPAASEDALPSGLLHREATDALAQAMALAGYADPHPTEQWQLPDAEAVLDHLHQRGFHVVAASPAASGDVLREMTARWRRRSEQVDRPAAGELRGCADELDRWITESGETVVLPQASTTPLAAGMSPDTAASPPLPEGLDRCDYVCWRERGHEGGHVMTGDRFPEQQPISREGA